MVSIITNQQEIATPAPSRLRYGLFTAATVTDDLDDRGIASGFQFAAEDCGVARLYDAQCLPSENDAKTFDAGLTFMEADPYWVYATYRCGTVGTTAEDVTRRVGKRLATGEQQQVEAAIWGGTTPLAVPNFEDNVGTIVAAPGAVGAGAAIAALEEAFYDAYGYLGTIHINTRGYAAAAYANLVLGNGGAGVLTTPLGSLWSIGSGYDITGPAGVAPAAGHVWAFMTPPVIIKRATVRMPDPREVLDRTLNQWNGLAERVYTHAWLCPTVAAVQVPIAAPAVGTAPAVPA